MTDEYEHIVQHVGQFGRYQFFIFLLLQLSDLITAWTMLIPVFINVTPKTSCDPGSLNVSTNGLGNNTGYSVIFEQVNKSLNTSVCSSDNGPCEDLSFSDEFTSVVSEWSLVCSQKYIPSLITTIQMIGVLVGAVVWSQLGDSYGRRYSYFATLGLNGAIGFLLAFSTTWQMFAVLRFFNGFCMGGLLNLNYIYPIEFVGPNWRTFCGCIGLWQVGQMTLALLAYFIRDWHHLCMATSLPSLLLVLTFCVLPESPRWLSMKGRFEEAEKILTRIAVSNGKKVPDFTKLRTFVQEEKQKLGKSKKYSFWDLFRTPAMTRQILIMMYTWFVCASVFYGLIFNIKNLSGDRYINTVIMGAIDIPAVWSTVFLNQWAGRRITLFASMLVAGCSLFVVLFIDIAGGAGAWTLGMALLGKFGIAMAWSLAYLYSAELFPTVVRNLAMGICSTAGRIGGIAAPQLVYIGQGNDFAPLPFIIFGALGLIAAAADFFLPETRGKPLPDNIPAWSWRRRKSNHPEEGATVCSNDILLNNCTANGDTENHIEESPLDVATDSSTDKLLNASLHSDRESTLSDDSHDSSQSTVNA